MSKLYIIHHSACRSLGVALGGLLCMASCVDYNDATDYISATVRLEMPAEFTQGTDYEGHDITLQLNGQRITATTNNEGVATFTNLIPDVYDISTSWEITNAQYQALTGDASVNSGCTVSGSLNSHLIAAEQTITLETILNVNRDIVIGKVYYAGSKDNNNRSYLAGKFIELYNQSNNPVDVGGLYIGLVEAESTQAYTLDNLHEVYADSVVLLKQVFRIPEQEHLVKPGGTVLIVNSAIDHTTNNDLDYNLLDADFEAKDASGRTQNNPATPALELIYSMYSAVSNMNLVQSGPCGVVIFRTNDDPTAWPRTYRYQKTTGNQWLLLPKRHIIDGVEILGNKASGVDVNTKRLYSDIDAGYTNIEATSGWTGEIVYRKTQKTGDSGQRILTDTNNSTNDFKVSTTIGPRNYDE
ncbi:MAG: DUF4876 domain-containing protein [Prevotella sp.]|nr:DUF4876 domain-containing protein [Prevotella sp.]